MFRRDSLPNVAAWLLCGLLVSTLFCAERLRQIATAAESVAAQRTRSRATPEVVPEARPALAARTAMTLIPAGSYEPFFKRKLERPASVTASFLLDSLPVTRAAYLDFVRRRPEWRRSAVKPLFAEPSYLSDWRSELDPGRLADPVLFVSWFAARAYCAGEDKRLPTLAEWELAAKLDRSDQASAGDMTLASPASAGPFAFAMAGLGVLARADSLRFSSIWEWTSDFNSAPLSDSRGDDKSLFCGDGYRASDARNYGAFLRYSLRSSLKANYALKNLGFRCAKDAP